MNSARMAEYAMAAALTIAWLAVSWAASRLWDWAWSEPEPKPRALGLPEGKP